jgi:hypothetical protein
MKTVTACMGSATFLAFAVVSAVQAQEKPAVQTTEPSFHRMEIYNGPLRSVYYSAAGASTGERLALREVQRSENEAALADQLLAMRRQSVNDESILQNRRRNVQQLFYGYSSTVSAGLLAGTVSTLFPFGFGYPAFGFPFYPGFGSVITQHGLSGVGDEGPIKTELARMLAAQAGPEYAAQAYSQYYNALTRAAETNSRIAAVVGVPSKGGIRPAQYQAPLGPSRLPQPGTHVVVSRKVGANVEKVEGNVVSETGDWMVLDTKAGRLTIAKNSIVDILEPK